MGSMDMSSAEQQVEIQGEQQVEANHLSVLHPPVPLSQSVSDALEAYLACLGGHEPVGLHRIVMEEVERTLFAVVMQYTNGNQTQANRCLGMNRNTFRKRLEQYGLI